MRGPKRTSEQISGDAANRLVPILGENGIAIELLEVHGQRTRADFGGKLLGFNIRTIEGVWARTEVPTELAGGFSFAFALTARTTEDAEREVFGELLVRFQVIYTFTESLADVSDEDLEQFYGYYGFIHVWPFARAEIQTLTAKVGVPPLTLPVLKTGRLPTALTVCQIRRDDADQPTASPPLSE